MIGRTPRYAGLHISRSLSGLVLQVGWISLNGVADPAGFGWPISADYASTYGIGVVSFLDDWRGVPVAVRLAIIFCRARFWSWG